MNVDLYVLIRYIWYVKSSMLTGNLLPDNQSFNDGVHLHKKLPAANN